MVSSTLCMQRSLASGRPSVNICQIELEVARDYSNSSAQFIQLLMDAVVS